MDDILRHRRVFSVFRWICAPFMRWKFNYEYECLPEINGPYLLLSNHNTDYDPIALGLAARHQLYFVATEKITRMGVLSWFVMRYFRPIIHYKGKTGIKTVKEMLSTLKSGTSVALFPEGNRSFNGQTCEFLDSTGKVAKRSGAAMVTYRLHGGYFSSPRWGKGTRKGTLRGEIVRIYSPDELAAMTAEEINEAIRRDLYVDAYEDQAKHPVRFRGKARAVGLESMLFLCPNCGTIGTLHSAENEITCSCGYRAEYSEFGYLEEAGGEHRTITSLDFAQRERIRTLAREPATECLFSDMVTVQHINKEHAVVRTEMVRLAAYSDRLKVGEFVLPFAELDGLAIHSRNLLIVHYDEGTGHMEMLGDISFNALKYYYLYQASGNEL